MATKKNVIDWKKVKSGDYFTAIISGQKSIGKIQKKGDKIYLCQDNRDGENCDNKFGFRYSWTIGNGTNHIEFEFENLKTSKTKPTGYKEPKYIMIGEYEVTIKKGYIMVGCTHVNNDLIRSIVKKLKD